MINFNSKLFEMYLYALVYPWKKIHLSVIYIKSMLRQSSSSNSIDVFCVEFHINDHQFYIKFDVYDMNLAYELLVLYAKSYPGEGHLRFYHTILLNVDWYY